MSSQPSISTGTELEQWTAVGSRLCGGETSRDSVELVLSSFYSSNKKYDRGGKIFSLPSHNFICTTRIPNSKNNSLVIHM